jgi:hypothetical protein
MTDGLPPVLGYLQKDYEGVIKALKDGKLNPHKMITSKIRVDRVVEDGYTPYVTCEADGGCTRIKALADSLAGSSTRRTSTSRYLWT